MKEDQTINTIQVTVVTPNETIFDQSNIKMVVLTSLSGELGIMHDHVPMVVALAISEMHLTCDDGREEKFAVNGGFAEFIDNHLTIIADSAEKSIDIDTFRAQKAEKEAQDALIRAQTAEDRARAQVALARAINRMKVSQLK